MAHIDLRPLSHAGFRYAPPQRRSLGRTLRHRLAHKAQAIDWVIPLAAIGALVIAALAAVPAGGDAAAAPASGRAAEMQSAAAVPLPGMPQILRQLDHSDGAMERCDGLTGQCRILPVEDRLFRMSDGHDWLARTAYDDHGQQAFTLWYDPQGTLVGTPVGL